MLRRAVKASVRFERTSDSVRGTGSRLWAEGVGHRLPTGFVDRHLVLVVEGQTARGELSAACGTEIAGAGRQGIGRPARSIVCARAARFRGPKSGTVLAGCSRSTGGYPPCPGKIEETSFDFPTTLSRLRLRVLYRRFWPEVARSKHWPDDEMLILEQTFVPLTLDD